MVMQTSAALNRTTRRISDSLLRLSTGNRLVRAETDSASFSIAAKLRARIAGMEQARNNLGDAQSMVGIAEQNLTQIHERLLTVRKLVIQGASSGRGSDERSFIRDQINGLGQEINALVDQASYQDIALLDGSLDAQFQVGEQKGSTLSLSLDKDLKVQDLVIDEVSSAGLLTASSLSTGTQLNDTDQFSGIQGGDTFDIVLTAGDGTQTTVSMTAAGSKGQLSTTTVGDLVNAINGTAGFDASFSGGGIQVAESSTPTGNNLSVSIGNFNEYPGTDGASTSLSFSFDSGSGDLVSNLSPGGVSSGTQLNSLNQFSQLEGQDVLSVSVTTRDGDSVTADITLPGSEGTGTNYTVGNLVSDLNSSFSSQGIDVSASLSGGQIHLSETDLSAFSISASASFSENNLDAGPAGVNTVSFNTITTTTVNTDLSAITGASALSGSAAAASSGLTLAENLSDGDTFDLVLQGTDGSTQTLTYTYTTGDTFSDLTNFINSNSAYNASINGSGEFVVEDPDPSVAATLDVQINNLSSATGSLVNTNFGPGSQEVLSSQSLWSPDSGSDFNTGTRLEDLNGFTNVQTGDTMSIQLRDGLGNNLDFTYTFGGSAGTTSDDTVQDLMNAISSQSGNLAVSFDTAKNAIIVEDTVNGDGGGLALGITGYTEQPYPNNATTPSPPLSFSYNTGIDGLQSQQLTISGSAAGSGTQITNLDGFANIENGDQLSVTLQNRAGTTKTVTLNFDNGSTGQPATETVGDLLNMIDGTVVGGVTMNATLNNGRIEITESNPADVGSFNASASLTENNIDQTPKSFSNINFGISNYLEVGADTGLVIGLGYFDFSDPTALTQSVSQLLLKNVDDSIHRVIGELNKVGTFQSQLKRREVSIQDQINKNEAVRSRIQDLDYAKEYSILVRNQIIQQYQIVSMVQANLSPSSVLDLL
jgi:flagellin-like hook-associated protein FlgL